MTALSLVPPAVAPVRFHMLKRLGRSPAHYRADVEKSSSEIDKGTAVHAVLLKGQRITFYPKLTKAGNAAPRNGEDWEAFKAANADAKILTREEYDETMFMVESVRRTPRAMEVLRGVVEESIYFEYMGRACRTTPDVRGYDYPTEMKTARSSRPRDFKFQALSYRYHAQVAFHSLGMEIAGHGRPDHCYFVAIESSPPYPVSVMELSPRALREGRRLIDEWMARLLACEATDSWPGYAEEPFDVTDDEAQRYGADVRD